MKLKTREVAIFGMLGALMYASKVFMELLPNVHLLGVFTISFTLVSSKLVDCLEKCLIYRHIRRFAD